MNKLLLVILLTILVIVIIFVLIMASRFKRYSKIFNLNHYHEICQRMDDIKEAAIQSIPGDANHIPIKKERDRFPPCTFQRGITCSLIRDMFLKHIGHIGLVDSSLIPCYSLLRLA